MDEDPVDPRIEIEEACKPSCTKAWSEYEKCLERMKKDTTGEAHCTGQYLDFWHCLDKCSASKIWSRLK